MMNQSTSMPNVASNADVLKGSSRVSSQGEETRDEPLRTSALEAMPNED